MEAIPPINLNMPAAVFMGAEVDLPVAGTPTSGQAAELEPATGPLPADPQGAQAITVTRQNMATALQQLLQASNIAPTPENMQMATALFTYGQKITPAKLQAMHQTLQAIGRSNDSTAMEAAGILMARGLPLTADGVNAVAAFLAAPSFAQGLGQLQHSVQRLLEQLPRHLRPAGLDQTVPHERQEMDGTNVMYRDTEGSLLPPVTSKANAPAPPEKPLPASTLSAVLGTPAAGQTEQTARPAETARRRPGLMGSEWWPGDPPAVSQSSPGPQVTGELVILLPPTFPGRRVVAGELQAAANTDTILTTARARDTGHEAPQSPAAAGLPLPSQNQLGEKPSAITGSPPLPAATVVPDAIHARRPATADPSAPAAALPAGAALEQMAWGGTGTPVPGLPVAGTITTRSLTVRDLPATAPGSVLPLQAPASAREYLPPALQLAAADLVIRSQALLQAVQHLLTLAQPLRPDIFAAQMNLYRQQFGRLEAEIRTVRQLVQELVPPGEMLEEVAPTLHLDRSAEKLLDTLSRLLQVADQKAVSAAAREDAREALPVEIKKVLAEVQSSVQALQGQIQGREVLTQMPPGVDARCLCIPLALPWMVPPRTAELYVYEDGRGAGPEGGTEDTVLRVRLAMETRHLGTVAVDFQAGKRDLRCTINVADAQAHTALGRQLPELAERLRETSLNLQALSVRQARQDLPASQLIPARYRPASLRRIEGIL